MGRLVRLELYNFKSYRDHQTIGPFYDFTAVIGPNGAGKSNLMDAISFVLGIKSAQLRSSQLKDLIYRGGAMTEIDVDTPEDEDSLRKAWVMAVYEDAAKKEIKFQRSITATGVSEYKINGKSVNFGKYTSTLEKENILIKARNFLVFQGDVEAVASQSPKDLTRLIEQISGSLDLKAEYDQLKVLQERATETSAFNFNKKRGITAEIKQYQEQKAEADRYDALLEELDDTIVNHFLWKLFHIEDSARQTFDEIKEKKEDLRKLIREHDKVDGKLQDSRRDQARIHKDIITVERDIKQREKTVEERRPALVGVRESIALVERKLEKLSSSQNRVEETLREQETKIDGLKDSLKSTKRASDRFEDVEAKKAKAKGITLSDAQLKEYNDKKVIVNQQASASIGQRDNLKRQHKADKESVDRLRDRLESLAWQKESLNADEKETSKRREQLSADAAKVERDLDAAKRNLAAMESERRRFNRTETELAEKLQTTQTQLLQARADQHESQREARNKEILASLKRSFAGVHGRVVDLCKPTQRKYDVAVAIILGGNLDAIVVDREKTALECIQYLREQRAPPSTFLPLDTLVVKPINDRYRSFAKGARLAMDVVQYDQYLERAIQYACGNALVCDTVDIARHICYDKNQEVKAVTLDGTVIHKSGLITGGSTGASPSQRWEEQEVEGLRRQRDQLLAQLADLQKEKQSGFSADSIRSEIDRLEDKLRVCKEALHAAERRSLDKQTEMKHVDESIAEVTPRLDELQSRLDKLEEEMQNVETEVHEVEDEVFATFCDELGIENIRVYDEQTSRITQEFNEVRLRFATQISKIENSLSYEEQARDETMTRLINMKEALDKDTSSLQALRKTKEELTKTYAELSEEIAALTTTLADLQRRHQDAAEKVMELKREDIRASREVDKVQKGLTLLESEIERLSGERFSVLRRCKLEAIDLPLESGSLEALPLEESALARSDNDAMDVDGAATSTRSKSKLESWGIEISYDGLLDGANRESEDVEQELADRIKQIQSEIERMAPNLKAIERLDTVERRLQDTEKEFDKARRDARTAKERFSVVKARRAEHFNNAYTHIAESIDRVYKDLTKSASLPMGGTAYLSLEDADEPYLEGVKYHAMPPMKRFRDMEQLSGGEKTMAALALLLAIHSYHPSPFFVLDEVDAALDNTNVAKIATYIREQAQAQKCQFIMISLKTTLYEKAQALVGIYRNNDKMSSGTLTLDLDQYAE